MKKQITLTLLLLLAGLGLTGCGNDYYEDGVVQMYTDHFTVEAEDWRWNPRYERLEYVHEWRAIDNYMYEQGAMTCGVYITEENGRDRYEVLHSLPFVQTYPDGGATYTVTIGYDISPGSIAFYIQDSDLMELDVEQDYTFKISLIWRE